MSSEDLDDILNSPQIQRKRKPTQPEAAKKSEEVKEAEIEKSIRSQQEEGADLSVSFSDNDTDDLLPQTPRSDEDSSKKKQSTKRLLLDDDNDDEFLPKSTVKFSTAGEGDEQFQVRSKQSDTKRVAFDTGDDDDFFDVGDDAAAADVHREGRGGGGGASERVSKKQPAKGFDAKFSSSFGSSNSERRSRTESSDIVNSSMESDSAVGAYQPWKQVTSNSDDLLAGIDLTPKKQPKQQQQQHQHNSKEPAESEPESAPVASSTAINTTKATTSNTNDTTPNTAPAEEATDIFSTEFADAAFASKGNDSGARRRGRGRRDESVQLSQIFGGAAEQPTAASLSTVGASPEMLQQLQMEVRRLRLEQQQEQQLQQLQLQKSQEQLQLIEKQHQLQLSSAEQSFKRREDRLQQEIKSMESQQQQQQQQHSQQLSSQRSEHQQQLDSLQQQHQQQFDLLQQQQRTEMAAIKTAAPHAGELANLVEQLALLADKLLANGEAMQQWRLRDETARAVGEGERKAMMELVQTLNSQCSESKRTQQWLQQFGSDLMEERRALSSQRSELHSLQQQQQHLQQQRQQSSSEADGERTALVEERQRLQELEAALRRTRAEALRLRSDAETMSEELQLKEKRLSDKQKSLDQRAAAITQQEQQLQQQQATLAAQQQQLDQQQQRSDSLQQQLQSLRLKEREVSAARLQLAEQQEQIDKKMNSLLCASCSQPVRDQANIFNAMRASVASVEAFVGKDWEDVEEERLYLQSLDFTHYGSTHS